MPTSPVDAAGEAMPSRRRSQKFGRAGWYAFDFGKNRPRVVQYATGGDRQFISLSNGPLEDPWCWFSPDAFDLYCIGVCQKVGRDGRPMS